MASPGIADLIGAASLVSDLGADPSGKHASAALINQGLASQAARSAGTLVFSPPGTYKAEQSVRLQNNLALCGMGSLSVFRLADAALDDVLVLSDLRNVRLKDFKVDGNRAGQSSGTRHGIWLYQCQDVWIENVEVAGASYDGIRLDDCERIHLAGVSCHDCGRHGVSISYGFATSLSQPSCYDNCQAVTAGQGHGIYLELLTQGTAILGPHCYETSRAGQLQGYGIVEAPGEGVGRTAIIYGYLVGNATGDISLESSDSAKLPT